MKLAILGGGGFRVPLVHGAVLDQMGPEDGTRIDEIWLHDVSSERLDTMVRVLRGQVAGRPGAPSLHATISMPEAVAGADFVFSAIRVSGLEGRCCDERVALDMGLLGQETTGAGGLIYGLRTLPEAMRIARVVAEEAPGAWVINFTNPAGMITQAMQQVLGPRVIGICDSPIGLGRRAAQALGLDPAATRFGYSGLNHLGWLQSLTVQGRDVLPDLLARPDLLKGTEEGRLFGPEWLGMLGAIPNEYLYYYYFNRDTVAAIRGAAETRGEYLRRTQAQFYRDAAASDDPYRVWVEAHHGRDASYMAEARAEGEERDEADMAAGGYEGVAVAIMRAISAGERASIILNVRNGSALAGLPADAVVEVPCVVDGSGPVLLEPEQLTGHMLGLAATVKECEMGIISAAESGSDAEAIRALAIHPLVDSATSAKKLLAGYRAAIPEVEAVFSGR